MSHGKQFTLYTYASGPNGWQVQPHFSGLERLSDNQSYFQEGRHRPRRTRVDLRICVL